MSKTKQNCHLNVNDYSQQQNIRCGIDSMDFGDLHISAELSLKMCMELCNFFFYRG